MRVCNPRDAKYIKAFLKGKIWTTPILLVSCRQRKTGNFFLSANKIASQTNPFILLSTFHRFQSPSPNLSFSTRSDVFNASSTPTGREMSCKWRPSTEGMVRERPIYWYTVCKWTCRQHQPPISSKDCDNRRCDYGATCWYGHHGDIYTDATEETNTFINGTSVHYDKYPKQQLPDEHPV